MATELETLEFTEALFAETSANIILRTQGNRALITAELKNLMRVHRGAVLAAYFMELARKQDSLPQLPEPPDINET